MKRDLPIKDKFMEKDKTLLYSPLFLKYQTDFEKNPKSRVFAPLAEIYRKVGMTEKSMEILSQGLRYHPDYVMGYLGLAFCYFDVRQYNLTYTTLRPFIVENRDNIRMQKLFAETCISLDKQDEALETLKYLLFINPRDKEISNSVTNLEKKLESSAKIETYPLKIAEEISSKPEESFQVEKLVSSPKEDFDNWMAVNLNVETLVQPEPVVKIENEWKMDPFKEAQKVNPEIVDSSPVVTHTLVDLYCGQGHLEKALSVLDKILILNPTDKRTSEKRNEILKLIYPSQIEIKSPLVERIEKTEEDGRKQLMDYIDEHVQMEIPPTDEKIKTKQLEKRYQIFLKKIQKRALDYQARI
jgi:tetratricopeptide (TPR) repeat protein